MDRLSSCYFCGDAVDTAIEEYPLVDSEQYSEVDTGEQVVLCPSCRRKLTTVIERVLDAVSDDEPTDDGLMDLDPDIETPGDEEVMTATSVESITEGDPTDEDERVNGGSESIDSEDDPADEEENAGDSAGGTTSEGDDGEIATRDSTFERAEYNKVVRLLQNREFPVEVEEITVVARSAYGIDRTTTHRILEALIDRGVVEDRGDQLVRP